MTEINEVAIDRILNPTSIDLGEYVINPYMGCEYSCMYCYVKSNKAVYKKKKPWGTYVNVRMNAPDLLKKEIEMTRPKTVLLGSTTECFQPVEHTYQITKKIIEILHNNNVSYVILTRSPYILEYLPLLKQGFCSKIYFTTNNFNNDLKQLLEPESPSFAERNNAIITLLEEGLTVIPYFSPVVPWITDLKNVFCSFTKAKCIEFEFLNFNLKDIHEIVNHLLKIEPSLKKRFDDMLNDKEFYGQMWGNIERDIEAHAVLWKKEFKIYKHDFGKFFENSYS
ncbi:MAG: radical SAM protein [Planctomycetes bacterium]|nr:radical SAM protein [Planctomycetota bacterium]